MDENLEEDGKRAVEEEGKVIKAGRGIAVIEIAAKKECARCSLCGLAGIRRVTLKGREAEGLETGSAVRLRIRSGDLMRVYFLVYGLPLAAFVTGAFLLHALSGGSEVMSFFGACALTVLVYVLISRYIAGKDDILPDVSVEKMGTSPI